MRLAGSSFARAFVGTVVLMAAMVCWPALLPMSSAAAVSPLTLTASKYLSVTSAPVVLSVEGPMGLLTGRTAEQAGSLRLVIGAHGPAEPPQVGKSASELPDPRTLNQVLTVEAATKGDGSLRTTLTVPANMIASEGAYLVTVQVNSLGRVLAEGSVWVGRVAARKESLSVAVVWPLALGVHRAPDGTFFDTVLDDAVADTGLGVDSVRSLTDLPARFPNWHFTVAVEPILLAQLRDMADGFIRSDGSGSREAVAEDGLVAVNAAQTLAQLTHLASAGGVEVLASPYASPSTSVLAAQGWRDGFEHMQLGKQVVQQTLGLSAPPTGAYSSDLDMATNSLASFSQASIDHVLVDAQVAEDLTEHVDEGAVAARVRDTNNERLTLVLASSGIRQLMKPPWDIGVLFAGIAAELAAGHREAMVITPDAASGIPPASYLKAVGEELGRYGWVETCTLTELLRKHSPGSRPVLLDRSPAESLGYIEESLLTNLQGAHSAVEDLAGAAESTRDSVQKAYLLLYTAESRWWSLAQTSPEVASIGLAYAEQARALAEGELAKLTLVGGRNTTIAGRNGTVVVVVENSASYPLNARLQLAGTGMILAGGDNVEVELQPGKTEVPIDVGEADGAHRLEVKLVVGSRILAEWGHSVRFVMFGTVLTWLIPAVVVVGGGVGGFLWRRRQKNRYGA